MSVPSSELALNALHVDFRSEVRGGDYRILISIPSASPPSRGYPVVYLIDGNLHFGITVDTMRVQACWPDVRNAVIVGIGYPTDRVADALERRMPDLTTVPQAPMVDAPWYSRMPTARCGYGHLDDYLRMLDEEIKPRVETLVPIDLDDQTIIGHSLGGLTALHSLFRRTASFQTYVAIAPSIWWNEREILAYEQGFGERVKAGLVKARLLLSVGALESTLRFPKGFEQALPAGIDFFQEMTDYCRMVPNVVELGARLSTLNSLGLEVQTVVHEGDDHNTVPGAGIARGIRFALRHT